MRHRNVSGGATAVAAAGQVVSRAIHGTQSSITYVHAREAIDFLALGAMVAAESVVMVSSRDAGQSRETRSGALHDGSCSGA